MFRPSVLRHVAPSGGKHFRGFPHRRGSSMQQHDRRVPQVAAHHDLVHVLLVQDGRHHLSLVRGIGCDRQEQTRPLGDEPRPVGIVHVLRELARLRRGEAVAQCQRPSGSSAWLQSASRACPRSVAPKATHPPAHRCRLGPGVAGRPRVRTCAPSSGRCTSLGTCLARRRSCRPSLGADSFGHDAVGHVNSARRAAPWHP
jgi:hypothetical protein